MKFFKIITLVVGFVSASAFAVDAPATSQVAPPQVAPEAAPQAETNSGLSNLDNELQSLSMPANQLPSGASEEKLYSVQSRYSPLSSRHEVSVGGAMNFTPGNLLTSQQLDLTYRFHISDRWNVGLSGSMVFNSFSATGDRLLSQEAILPDVAYAKYKADLLIGYNIFYGKFRLSMEEVLYFDLYAAIGPGFVFLDSGRQTAAVGDLGFVFWMGKKLSARIGLKDDFYNEVRRQSSGMSHNLLGHLDIGILFGGNP